MAGIVIDKSKCTLCEACVQVCPFKALSIENGVVEVNANCKMCRICVKQCPFSAISIEEEKKIAVDKSLYSGILVYVEHLRGKIHPVTYELIGKARELVSVVNQEVYCVFIGKDVHQSASELLQYGVKQVFVYEDEQLEFFKVDTYANVFYDCIQKLHPQTVLVGATTTGRSLAPRVATRLRTGLTADCTVLQMRENTDLVQIRPAFGGNIMAQILTTNNRPQFATVRYKVMNHAKKVEYPTGEVVSCAIDPSLLKSKIDIIEVHKNQEEIDIAQADILVVAGNGVKDEKGFELVKSLAKELGGMVAVTRPLVEKNFASYLYQIGLSGRTVKPKLIITCGVSGAIQFVAGMNSSEVIVAIDSNPEATIFKTAHYAIVGDLYEILPSLIEQIKGGKNNEI